MMPAFVDMSFSSSKLKWMSQHSPDKKIAQPEGQSQFDIWRAIQSHKETDSNLSAPTSYIHPLVTRSVSSLSDKSLEICTESLGSETGSDGFSSLDDLDHSSSYESEEEEDDDEVELEHVGAVQYNCSISRKLPPRSFPPPLPSLSGRDGPCLHIRPRREDGRLVLEAVRVPPHNYLHAQRQGGRLLLTFINTPSTEENQSEDIDDVDNEEEEEEEEEEEKGFLAKEPQLAIKQVEEGGLQFNQVKEKESMENAVTDKKIVLKLEVSGDGIPSRLMKVNQSAIMVRKIISNRGHRPLRNFNPWVKKSEEREEYKVVAQVLPREEPFNDYECLWRDSYTKSCLPSSNDMAFFPEKEKDAAFFVRNCKDREPARRPFFILETHCIATS